MSQKSKFDSADTGWRGKHKTFSHIRYLQHLPEQGIAIIEVLRPNGTYEIVVYGIDMERWEWKHIKLEQRGFWLQ